MFAENMVEHMRPQLEEEIYGGYQPQPGLTRYQQEVVERIVRPQLQEDMGSSLVESNQAFHSRRDEY